MWSWIMHRLLHTHTQTHNTGFESRCSRGCWLTLRKWKTCGGQKLLVTASLSLRPPRSTECYSPHLHLHLHTCCSHYSKQTSICMENMRRTALLTHVLALCTHMTTLPPTSITLCLQSVFSGRSCSRVHMHNAPELCTLFHFDVTGVHVSCFLSTKT